MMLKRLKRALRRDSKRAELVREIRSYGLEAPEEWSRERLEVRATCARAALIAESNKQEAN